MISKKKTSILLVNLGIVAAAGLLAWIFAPSIWVEAQYQNQIKEYQDEQQGADKPIKGFGDMIDPISGFKELLEEELIAPVSSDFGLVIPKIFANVTVTENVNPAITEKYQTVLRQAGGVAHAAGTATPDEPGTVYIFGHSTDSNFNVERFNAVFYLLRKLESGDLIIVYYQGKAYRYWVEEKKVVKPDNIDDIINIKNDKQLVLQTCWPPGTTWRRLLIIAKPEQV